MNIVKWKNNYYIACDEPFNDCVTISKNGKQYVAIETFFRTILDIPAYTEGNIDNNRILKMYLIEDELDIHRINKLINSIPVFRIGDTKTDSHNFYVSIISDTEIVDL